MCRCRIKTRDLDPSKRQHRQTLYAWNGRNQLTARRRGAPQDRRHHPGRIWWTTPFPENFRFWFWYERTLQKLCCWMRMLSSFRTGLNYLGLQRCLFVGGFCCLKLWLKKKLSHEREGIFLTFAEEWGAIREDVFPGKITFTSSSAAIAELVITMGRNTGIVGIAEKNCKKNYFIL